MRRFEWFAAAIALATATPAFGADTAVKPDTSGGTSVSVSSGIDYSTGKYGESKSTDILVGLTNLSVTSHDVTLSASLPYLTIAGPSFVVVGPGGVPVLIRPRPGTCL